MLDILSGFLSLSNLLYALGLIIVYALSVKYGMGKIVKEVKEVFVAIEEANADGKMTNVEMKKIIKEVLDVGKVFLARQLGIG